MSRQLGVNTDKLSVYLQYLNDEVAWEPDPEQPRKPCLTATQQDMFLKYSFAWGMVSIGRTDEMVRSSLEKQFGIKEGMARVIIDESYHIYGNAREVHKKGKTRAAVLYLEMLSNLARADKDYKTAKEAWVEAKRLEGLYREDAAGFDPEDFMVKPNIVFVNNVNILKQQQRDDDE
ncbi:hypothetical protein BLX24_03690 [Arsenicibacter rosenii]|uniref:Uncharacterized protein n=2 Tax=Arsenicibacter rosenii TaxID=1750698 RepID=A0A1S2VQW1_9BACT|nr:hypothetical protein BLX24_03690 [Arsenicibacter rosenii]